MRKVRQRTQPAHSPLAARRTPPLQEATSRSGADAVAPITSQIRPNLFHQPARQGQPPVFRVRPQGGKEVGKLPAVDTGHVQAVLRLPADGKADIGRAVGQLDQRGVGRGADARVILLARPFGPRAPLVVRQCIDNLGSQKRLPLVEPQGCGAFPRVVVSLPGVLYAVVEPRAEHEREHVVFPHADFPAIAGHSLGHPVQVIGVGQPAAIQLVDRSMQLVGRPADALQGVRLGLQYFRKLHSQFH